MKKKHLLVLTDHSKHNEHNSLYPIVRALHRLKKFDVIDVASRGFHSNKAALIKLKTEEITVHSSTPEFTYSETSPMIEENLHLSEISAYDFLLLRIPRPLPQGFFDYLISYLPANKIFNNPKGIEKTSSKEYLLNFPGLTPPTRLCYTVADIETFAEAYDTVIKPLRDYGGRGIVRLNKGGFWIGNEKMNRTGYEEYFNKIEFPVLAMKFLTHVHKGDKRIVVAGDKIILSTMRIPGEGNWICNVAQGGKAVPTDIKEREKEIALVLSKHLVKEGIILYGFDTLEDGDGLRYLSEINTLSIGGIGPSELLTGKPITSIVAQELWSAMKRAE